MCLKIHFTGTKTNQEMCNRLKKTKNIFEYVHNFDDVFMTSCSYDAVSQWLQELLLHNFT